MAKFLTTNWVSSYIESIITTAKKEVYLVSPYLQLSQTFIERLQDAEDHNVQITIVYGKSDLNPKEMESIAALDNLTLHFSKNLHAKCYFNETQMVITSMNMYEFSEKKNREMGVYIDKALDNDLYIDAYRETKSIIKAADLIELPSSKKQKAKNGLFQKKTPKKKAKTKTASCIRCEDEIPFNTERPYCRDCYNSWSKYGNTFYEENVCHNCGGDNNSTIEKPVCYSCFKENSLSF